MKLLRVSNFNLKIIYEFPFYILKVVINLYKLKRDKVDTTIINKHWIKK